MNTLKKFAALLSLSVALCLAMADSARANYSYNAAFSSLINGDFESGSTGWVKTSGYFSVGEYPGGSGNHVGILRGASGYTSTIQQTISGLTPGYYAFAITSIGGYAGYTVNLSGTSAGQTTSCYYCPFQSNEDPPPTLDFCVPDGTATVKISVTGTPLLGRYIRIDDIFLVWIGSC
jgi:hypothetical protein